MKICDQQTGMQLWSGKDVTDGKIEQLKAGLHDLNAQYPESETVEDVAVLLEGTDECPNEVLEVLALVRCQLQ